MKHVFYMMLITSLIAIMGAEAYGSDETIANDITAAVTRADLPKPFSLQVDVTLGDVVLSGKVPSRAVSERIESIARQIKGVKDLKNDIEVAHMISHSTSKENEALCREIEAKLATLERVNEFRVFLDCEADTVRLTGTAYREDDIAVIESTVRRIPGVQNVVNQLRLPPVINDSYLEEAVREEMRKNGISLAGLSFSIKDGIATFSGHVDSHEKIDQILAQTLMVRGIKDLRSEVVIGQGQ